MRYADLKNALNQASCPKDAEDLEMPMYRSKQTGCITVEEYEYLEYKRREALDTFNTAAGN